MVMVATPSVTSSRMGFMSAMEASFPAATARC
jgi:hypothetical protein